MSVHTLGRLPLAYQPAGTFGTDPWWLVVLKAVGIFVFLVVMTLLAIWWERRVVARMQHRIGPNRVGPQGLLQSLADGIKLALKEDIVPRAADKVVFVLAPVLAAVPAFMAYAVMPFGPQVSIFGHRTMLQLTDLPVAVLYVIAVTSIGVYGIVLAGWSSGSTYPLLGALRSSAQVISYEIAMGLSFVAVFLFAGSMSTSQIVNQQTNLWFAIPLLPSFLIYATAMVGETNRAPFDLPEAEGELVGGFHTEYSSLKFALFFLAEYINMVTVSTLATTLFLGGWRAPWPLSLVGVDPAHPEGLLNTGWWPVLWFIAKINIFIFVFIWLRGTLPRLRYDQFMRIGWKILIPVSLLWILAVAAIRALTLDITLDRRTLFVWVGGVLAVVFVVSLAWDTLAERRGAAGAQDVPAAGFDPMAGGYPVPPLPGQSLPAYADLAVSPVSARAGSAEPDGTRDPVEGDDA